MENYFPGFKKYTKGLLFILTVLSPLLLSNLNPAWAAEEADHVFTLKESVAIALERSPKLLSAVESLKGAKWKKSEAAKKFLPKFDLTYSWTRLDKAPKTSTLSITPLATPPYWSFGSQSIQVGTKDNWQLKLSMTQPLFTGFALTSARELSKLGVNIAEISLDRARLDLVLEVKQAYFGILRAQKVAEVAIQAVKQREAHLNVARNFYEVGMIPKNKVLEAEVLLAEAIQDRTKAENAVSLAKAGFNTILRRSLEARVEVEDILIYKPFPHTFEYCLNRSFEKRPEIKAVTKQIQIGEQNVRLAKADYYPSVVLQANHYFKGDTWKVDGSPYLKDNTSWDVSTILTWNLWSWGQTKDQVQFKRTELAKARNTMIQIKDGIALEVKSNYLSLKEAGKRISVARKAVEQAKENYRMSRERFREQVATSTEVTDAETLLTAARRNYYEALYSYNLAWAKLERAMGLGRDEI